MNFDLEEQLMRSGSENVEDNERGRAYTIMESSLQEKDQVIRISHILQFLLKMYWLKISHLDS